MARRHKVGDLYAIELPNKKYAFAKAYKSEAFGFYKFRSDNINDLPKDEKFEFFGTVYPDFYEEWTYIKNIPFSSEEESWYPPFVIVDPITGIGRIYEKGQIRECTYEECKDLDTCAIWRNNHIVDTLMGDDRWIKDDRRPQRIKIGSLYAIKLPNKDYAFARIYKNDAVGFYSYRSKDINDLPKEEKYDFHAFVNPDCFDKWKYIVNVEFNTINDSWYPPFVVVDAITGKGSIYEKGQIRECTYEECKDLDTWAIWSNDLIIDRLVGGDKWTKVILRPIKQPDQ